MKDLLCRIVTDRRAQIPKCSRDDTAGHVRVRTDRIGEIHAVITGTKVSCWFIRKDADRNSRIVAKERAAKIGEPLAESIIHEIAICTFGVSNMSDPMSELVIDDVGDFAGV